MGKMGKQDLPKYQSCLLKVNIHCEGCEHKVRKLLQKTDGVYSVNIDADSGKVLVAGNMDPAKLIKKLKRSGKHAELWGGQRGNMYNQNYPPINQFKNMQIDPTRMGKHNEPHKVMAKNQQKGGGGHPPHFQNQGAQNLMVPVKGQKSVKFNLPEEEDFDASDDEDLDEFDDDDEEFDDYEDEEEDDEQVGHAHPLMPNKANMMGGMAMANGRGPHGPAMNFHKANGGVNGKKGNAIDLAVQMKGKGGNKNGNGGGKKKNEERGGIKKDKGGKRKAGGDKKNGKNSGGFLGRLLGFGKKSKKADSPNFKKNGAPNNKANGKEAKKSGARFEGHKFKKLDDDDDDGFQDFDIPMKPKPGNKGVRGNGNGMPGKTGHMPPPTAQRGPMDQMRNIPVPAVQGLPAAAGMNGGFYQGMQMQPPRPLPYNPQQQQYMAMMMNQQQANMNQMYPGMMYGRPQAPMGYMPPPPMPSHPMADPMTHVFSDENTESCTIM
ncbi:heavy metal-associated isoprenylated plant protein 34 [Neltuma alba]|uniref:heavy metal-associated isoprenylated plant protein 34 n=1 Tax=Neltuma alba TaxID=207710 RepID=UPI0010A4CCAE|nr:heavy metal-associated isoprenylated plant protein 34-like [Prosopis alba]